MARRTAEPPERRPAPLGAVRWRGSTYPIVSVIFLKVKGPLEVAQNGLRCGIDLNLPLGYRPAWKVETRMSPKTLICSTSQHVLAETRMRRFVDPMIKTPLGRRNNVV